MKRILTVLTWIKVHKKISIIVGVILLILALVFRPKPAKSIDIVSVKNDTIITSLTATGTIDADKTVNLNFLSAGKLSYVGVKKGDSVKAGQVIARLDERSAQKNLQAALTDYAKQRNTFDQTKDNNGNVENPINAPSTALKRILQNNQYNLDKAVLSVVTPWSVVLAFFFSLAIGIIFGIAPALQAARLSPIDSLRYE